MLSENPTRLLITQGEQGENTEIGDTVTEVHNVKPARMHEKISRGSQSFLSAKEILQQLVSFLLPGFDYCFRRSCHPLFHAVIRRRSTITVWIR